MAAALSVQSPFNRVPLGKSDISVCDIIYSGTSIIQTPLGHDYSVLNSKVSSSQGVVK